MKERNNKHYFLAWETKRIIGICVATPFYIMLAMVLIVGAKTAAFQEKSPVAFVFIILILIFITLLYGYLIIPRYCTSMKAVRKYLSYRQLTQMVQDEAFSKFRWDRMEENSFKEADIWESPSWLMIKGVLIPKGTIMGLEQMVPDVIISTYSNLSLFTMDGRSWPVLKVDRSLVSDFAKSMQKAVPNLNISAKLQAVLWRTSYRKQMQQWFCKKIPDSQAYINLIKTGIDLSDMPDVEIAYQKINFTKQ